jgi:hypothetical protein
MFRLELLITSTNTLSLTLSPFNNLYMYNISSVTFKIDIVYSNLGLIQGLGCLFRMFHFYRVDLPSIVTNETNLAVSSMQAASRDATRLHTPWWSLVSLSSTWHLKSCFSTSTWDLHHERTRCTKSSDSQWNVTLCSGSRQLQLTVCKQLPIVYSSSE